jgi:predicted flap endonuclease-1-like 5' DNA nuclease
MGVTEMHKAENTNAPWLGGWVIGLAAGLVAFGVAWVVGKFDLVPSVAIGGVIALIAGFVLGMPRSREPAAPVPQARPARAAEPAPQPAPLMATPVAEPVAVAAPIAAVADIPSDGPMRLKAPRGGRADDLKEIEGIGPAMEKLVNELGFYHFDQIASWCDADVDWVDANMKNFKGRITRDKWVAQAKLIVSEGLEAFRIRAQTNNY